jgi:hypothetical protein
MFLQAVRELVCGAATQTKCSVMVEAACRATL